MDLLETTQASNSRIVQRQEVDSKKPDLKKPDPRMHETTGRMGSMEVKDSMICLEAVAVGYGMWTTIDSEEPER